ncbi:ferric reductase-like transmembrane domain-containing protein [Psychromicrobium xiongbiense]|uniref:ferric reductase-like transmembrane domain-containing protein n=1 Tax=Psychromicrobium xiongbiense TaxID=3051184 RepID=UPI0025573308|nr:ferric reductase-like transmembrane domain-containing protein [Psychromicrobium sp. YIM S02556]
MDEVLWATGRISGVTALLLITLSIVLGVVSRSGRSLTGTRGGGLSRVSLSLVHRNIALLSGLFVLLHIVTLLFDSFAQLSLANLVLPFLAAHDPFWQGLGTVAFDLLIAIVLTGLLRVRIGPAAFRLVHWLVYALWPLALLHGLGNGTDGLSTWFLVLSAASALAVLLALIWRLSRTFTRTSHLASHLEERTWA